MTSLNELRGPDRFAAAVELHKSSRVREALMLYDSLARTGPRTAELYNNRGIALSQLGRVGEALESYREALQIDPRNADALVNEGIALGEIGCFSLARDKFEQAISINPAHPLAQRYRSAAKTAADADKSRVGHANSLNERGLESSARGELDKAAALFTQAIALDPSFAAPHGNLAILLTRKGDWRGALESADRCLALGATDHVLHHSRALAFLGLGHYEEAIDAASHAIALDPQDAGKHGLRADALFCLGRYADAAQAFAVAYELDSSSATIGYGYARTLHRLGDAAGALAVIDSVLAGAPGLVSALNLRGLILQILARREEALESFNAALRLNPDDVETLANRAFLLQDLTMVEAAVVDLQRTLQIDPNQPFAASQLLHFQMRLSDWDSHDESLKRVCEGVLAGSSHCSPFALLALCDDPLVQKAASADHLARQTPVVAPPIAAHPRSDRIHVGYFSADFFSHATMYLMMEMLEEHDRERFKITAFSYGPNTQDQWRLRVEDACEHFVDVRDLSDEDIAHLARSSRVDIAIDLKGITGWSRHGIFARRAAPLQVSFLGYPGTMPCDFIDYVIADRTLIPPEERQGFAENIIYLPGSYQPNCRAGAKAYTSVSRAEAGLPERQFIFCCFNQNYKITPSVFDAWMEILKRSSDSLLWLWVESKTARANLSREAANRGVARERLVFAVATDRDSHLARLSLADLLLDTSPYGAHTSASDALRAGLPVLTQPGRCFASRVASSLLTAMDLPELICKSRSEYIEKAASYANSPELLETLKRRLLFNKAATSLFDPEHFARKLEKAFVQVYERSQAGLPPDDVHV